ncbi:MAG: PAS domain S-box protein [Promethearchaeota archaeon]
MILNNPEEQPKSDLHFADFVDDLIFILNMNFEIEYLNEKSLLKGLGYSINDILDHQLVQFSHPADSLELIKQLKKILKKGNGSHEIRLKHKKGNFVWYELNGNLFIDDNKKKLILILRNISKYKEKEKQYKEIEERLNAAPELRFWKFLYPQKLMSAVEKSRETLESVIDNIPLLIYWKDSNLNYIGCNTNYALINGFTDPNHIISKKDKDLIWLKYKLEKIRKAEQHVIKSGTAEYNAIEDWILPNGSKVWYNINRMPLSNLDNDVVGILTTYEDITERFILEQRIKESESKYRELHEKLKAGYFETDLIGNIKFINESFCEIIGYPRKELLDKNFKIFVDSQTKKEIYQSLNKIYETGVGLYDSIHKITRKDGMEIIIEISVYLRYNTDGEKVGFNGLIRDVTEKYVLEQKLKKSEEKYRNIINNISDIIVELDLELNFIYISPQCFDIFGFKPENLIGKNVYKFIHPKDVHILKGIMNIIKINGPIMSAELRVRHQDGHYIPIFVRGSLVEIDDSIKVIAVAMDISDKKEAEEKIKESEGKYRLITENVNDLISLLNNRARYEYINEKTHLKVLGYTKEDLLGKSILNFAHPDDANYGFARLKEGLTEDSGTFRVRHKDGHYLWVEVKAKVFYDKDNRMRVITISRDVTERKKAEEKIKKADEQLKRLNKELEQKVLERTKELKESEENFRTMAENSLLGIGIIKKGFIVYANKAMSEITEFSFEEMIGWKRNYFLKRIYSDDFPYILEQIQNKQRAGKETAARYSFRYVTKSGKIKWVELYSKFIQFQGEVADLNVMIDITDKKKAEEQLIESEKKYRNMINNLDVGFYRGQIGGGLLIHNSTLNKILGFDPNENLNGIRTDQFFVDPMEKTRYYDELMKNGFIQNYIAKVNDKNGNKLILQIHSHLIRNEKGEPIEVEGTFIDITEKFELEQKLKASEQKLREQNIELQKLDQLKTNFLTMVSHELKTPLISIGGYTDLILTKYDNLDAEIIDDLLRVQNNVKRLETYIEQLMDVLKIEAKKMELNKEITNVRLIVQDCINELDYQINQKKLNVELLIKDNLSLEVDSDRISQVFTNLLSNAIKYTPDKGNIKISSEKVEKDNKFLFKVKDSGIGIRKEQIKHLFEKFVMLEKNPESSSAFESGSGLGLYITKGIIEEHGGKIWAISEGKGTGSEFCFTLPFK